MADVWERIEQGLYGCHGDYSGKKPSCGHDLSKTAQREPGVWDIWIGAGLAEIERQDGFADDDDI